MELDWSAQSPHIRSLFHPWQPGDGYDEATIKAAEERLGVRLPATLRNFYLAWGERRDLTRTTHPLFSPLELQVRAGALIFWAENQAVWCRGIPLAALEEIDPPVVITELGWWEVVTEYDWKPSHAHLSSFLDDVTYRHALDGGAIHGGWTRPNLPELPAHHIAWLEDHWSKAIVSPLVFGVEFGPAYDAWPTLYVREGQAFYSFGWCQMAAHEAGAVDEIALRFQIKWARRW